MDYKYPSFFLIYMISQTIQDNIEEIIEVLQQAEAYNGYKMCTSIDTYLYNLHSRLMHLSDEKIGFFFEKTNSNARVGTYKITLKCTEEVEEYINENW